MNKRLMACALAVMLLPGCSSFSKMFGSGNAKSAPAVSSQQKGAKVPEDRFATKFIANELSNNMLGGKGSATAIVVTTFVDLNDFSKASVFGRLMAEQLINEMNRKGFRIVEIRRAQDIFVKKDVGELILTRDVAELAQNASANAILAGTYVATEQSVIINARLIDTKSPQVISTVSCEVVMTEEIQNLIRGVSPF